MEPENFDPENMTPRQFTAIQRASGLSDKDLAAMLGLSATNGERVIRRIKKGDRKCSPVIARQMINLLK